MKARNDMIVAKFLNAAHNLVEQKDIKEKVAPAC